MAAATAMLPMFTPCSCPRNPRLLSQLPGFLSSSPSSPSSSALKIHGISQASMEYYSSPIKASSSPDGLPNELVEDSNFVPLESDDPSYGPPALLLLGFDVQEASKVQQLLKDMDGDFLQIIYCTEDMIARSLWEAVNTRQHSPWDLKIAKSVPRICFLSGLSGEETMMFIDAFKETDLEPAVFAALVPNSADKPLRELVEEIMGDHEMLVSLKPNFIFGPYCIFPVFGVFFWCCSLENNQLPDWHWQSSTSCRESTRPMDSRWIYICQSGLYGIMHAHQLRLL
ncbi:hypothetical protein Dimus_016325 [Dionaea muscipula]